MPTVGENTMGDNDSGTENYGVEIEGLEETIEFQKISYVPSGCVEGIIRISLAESAQVFTAQSITIHLECKEKGTFGFDHDERLRTISTNDNNRTLQSFDRNEIFKSKASKTLTKITIWEQPLQSESLFKVINPGDEVELPFEIYLPSDIQPSFSSVRVLFGNLL